jgi:hypothetical protein
MIWSIIWYYLLALFTTADVITTRIAIALGAHEANPVLNPVVDNLTVIKLSFLLVAIAIIYFTEKHSEGNGWLPAAGGTMVTFTAVVSNIVWIASAL